MNKVGIILINWKEYAKKFLEECAISLRQINFPEGEYQIIITDNESSPETIETIKTLCPEAIIVPTDSNLGYGGGNNRGITKAIEVGCNYLYFLNMDTVVTPDFLSQALKKYQSDSTIGLVQSRLMLHGQENKINSIGNIAHFLGFGYFCGNDNDYDESKVKEIIGYPSGAGVMISREVFDKIGYFNEDFFMYHDDMEWGIKSILYGYKNVLAKDSVVYHKYEFARSIAQFYWMERNRWILWLITLKIRTLLLIFPVALGLELYLNITALFGGWLKEKWRSYAWFWHYKNLKKLSLWRHEIQQKRILKDKDLVKTFTSVIEFQATTNLSVKIGNILLTAYWKFIKLLIIW